MPKFKTHFTKKFAGHSGIGELMDDLGKAMANGDMLMLGGCNPAFIPEVGAAWRNRLQDMIHNEDEINQALANYDTPQGNQQFIEELVAFLNRHYDFGITTDNVAVTNGSQSAMFNLMNILGGTGEDGIKRKILFPVVPEYIGYGDQHLEEDVFLSLKPEIEMLDNNRFKYHIDKESLENVDDNLGAVCVSRPTNPTGNVLTDDEIDYLHEFCKKRNIPLIIDNAYGAPFPQILFQDIKPIWDEDIVLSMSLSKIGLPSTRTGIIVARKSIIKVLSSVNAITSLSTGSIGQTMTHTMLKDDSLLTLSKDVVQPYYKDKSDKALGFIDKYLDGVEFKVHVSEGALFLWLWFPGLPITSKELYSRLKDKRVLVVPGSYFFFGLDEDWPHKDECIRITYSQDEQIVEEGIRLIGETLKELKDLY